MNQEEVTRSLPLSHFQPREIEWLWNSRIPVGCVTMLEGDGGVGKSSVVASLGSAISAGRALPDDVEKEPMGVLLLAAEDDPAVVLRPRFERNGANLNLVRCYDQAMLLNKDGIEFLKRELTQHRFKLVVIDPIVSFLGQAIDASKASDVRSVMSPLHEIAREFDCAIVVVRHWNKSSTASASQRGSGSVDFRNAARSVLQVIKANDKRYLTLEKSNYGVDGKTLTFALENKLLNWTGASDLSADAILKEAHFANGDGASELEEASEFLVEELKKGPIESKDLEAQAKNLGISHATLKRAKKKVGVRSFKEQGRNTWMCELMSVRTQSKAGAPDQVQPAQAKTGEQVEPHELDLERQPNLFGSEEVV